MRFTEGKPPLAAAEPGLPPSRRQTLRLGVVALAALAGCAQPPRSAAPPTAVPPAAPPAAQGAAATSPRSPGAAAAGPAAPSAMQPPPAAAAAPGKADRGPIPRNPRYVKLGPPRAPRSEAELRLQMAQRLIEAHPDSTYTSRAPDRLLAIPVLEVDLNADGSVRAIKVLRKPTTGPRATELAIEAVRRAAPYGDVSRLPRPWRVVETFLFDDHLRFKPRTLDND